MTSPTLKKCDMSRRLSARVRALLLLVSVPFSYTGAFAQMDPHEVSVGQFRQFVQATGLVTQAERDGGGAIYAAGWEQRRGWTWQSPFGQPARDDEPAVHVTFDEAKAACRHFGKRLPTDTEWTTAAFLEQRASPPAPFIRGTRYPYPNGLSAQGSHCLQGCSERKGLAPKGTLERGTGHVPVKSTQPGVNGLFDMGGNVWEWVDGGQGEQRITRGGSWWYGPERQREDDLATKPRDTRVAYIGFRCFKP
jgi:formylglycine-generating enzyme required for sulfatase activity